MSDNITWFNTGTSVSKCDVSNMFSSSDSNGVCGINLREELNRILYGTGFCPDNQKGHWVKVRHYDKSTKSADWHEHTKEGVGGPAWDYTDTFVKTRRVPISKASSELEVFKSGIDYDGRYIYYFEYDVKLAKGDHIWELDYQFDHTGTPTSSTPLEDRYMIKRTHPYRLEQGRIEYWMISVEEDVIRY